MTKNELIAAVAERTHMSKIAAASAVEATFDAITATSKNVVAPQIMGSAFSGWSGERRDGRDPRTGAQSASRRQRLRFAAGKGLKEAVNR